MTTTTTPNGKTASQLIAAEVAAYQRARNPLIWIRTKEEARAESYLIPAAAAAGYTAIMWDCASGVRNADRTASGLGGNDPGDTLEAIRQQAASGSLRYAWIMRDLHKWLDGPIGIQLLRQLRNLARDLPATPRERGQSLIVISPVDEIPPELAGHATVIDWPLPDRIEIGSILDNAIRNGGDKVEAPSNGQRDTAIDAAVGLSGEEAAACYARSLVQLRKVDPGLVTTEKKRIIAREKVLEWMPPLEGGFDAVGGLDVAKSWMMARVAAYSPRARAYGLPAPRGIFLVGVSGCGKTMLAKAIASLLQGPLLRFDPGAMKSKYVGESEATTRRAYKTIDAVGRCVVLIDEIEKAVAGATQGAADGGVSADALGSLLTWMQERTCEAFLVATSNDVSGLPPELLRKGRWDELFFVDLPTLEERIQILAATLRTFKRDPATIALESVAVACDGFTGAELAALVPDAMFAAFADGERELTANDLTLAAKAIVPLSRTAKEKIAGLRSWAKERCRLATSPDAVGATAAGALDLD